jgi:hypothetical protein
VRTDHTVWKCDICGVESRHRYRHIPKWFWAHSKKYGIVHICDKCADKMEENEMGIKITPLGQ